MAYITQSDLVPGRMSLAELVQLTDDAGTGEVDTTALGPCIAQAEGLLESYVSGRYTLPLTATAQVKGLALDLCVFKLFSRRPSRAVPEAVQKNYEAALDLLRRVSRGDAALDQAAAQQGSEMDVVTKNHSDDPDVFDEKKLKAY